MVIGMFRVSTEELENVVHAELADGLPSFNGGVREFALLLLQGEDSFFDRVGNGQAVDYDVLCLVESVDSVDGLFFDKLDLGQQWQSYFVNARLTGFQNGSRMTTRLATVRLRPKEPHRKLHKSMRVSGFSRRLRRLS